MHSISETLKRLVSYFRNITTYRYSKHSGQLYIIWRNGNKILESDNANYSFASLHRIMRFVFGKIEFSDTGTILLLGLGGGSVIKILRNELKKPNQIIAVDIDSVMIDIAQKEFALDSYSHTEIICQDAYVFVHENTNIYELIIIDLFIDDTVPTQFFDTLFWENILRILQKGGQVVFNMMKVTTEQSNISSLIEFLESQGVAVDTYDKVDGTNYVLIGKTGKK